MKKRGILAVNLAVLLFGLAGLFAKWIRLPAIAITFGRVLFSSLALGLYLLLRRQSVRVARPGDRLLLAAAGGILALHWWAFLQSIQLSSVAIGTITFSSFPLFVTFLEPLLFRQKLERRNVFIALLILIGVLITVPEFSLDNHVFAGILIGMLSALGPSASDADGAGPAHAPGSGPAAGPRRDHHGSGPHAVHQQPENAARPAGRGLFLPGDGLRDPVCPAASWRDPHASGDPWRGDHRRRRDRRPAPGKIGAGETALRAARRKPLLRETEKALGRGGAILPAGGGDPDLHLAGRLCHQNGDAGEIQPVGGK